MGLPVVETGDRWHVSVGSRYDQQGAHGFDVLNPVTSPYVHQFVTAVTSQAGLVFELTKLFDQLVVLAIGNFRILVEVVEIVVPINQLAQLANRLFD